MRKLVAAAAALSLLAGVAHAQGMGGKKHRAAQKSETKKPKVDDNAYKAALDKIPDPKEKFDPWKQVR